MTLRSSPAKCPRCQASIRGEYRFCPLCAFRLEVPGPLPASPRRHTERLVFGAVAVLLLGGLVVVAWTLSEGKEPPLAPPVYRGGRDPTQISSLEDALVHIPGGVATWEPVPEGGDSANLFSRLPLAESGAVGTPPPIGLDPRQWLSYVLPAGMRPGVRSDAPARKGVEVSDFYIMRHEVTCGQWAAFLRAIESSSPSTLDADWIHSLWVPEAGRERRYTDGYVAYWVAALRREFARRPHATFPQLATIAQVPISPRARALLAAPPSWIHADAEHGGPRWELPAGADALPVSGISAVDAEIFAVWARTRLRLAGALKLPNYYEWLLAFHGGHPSGGVNAGWKWPWGNQANVLACNNAQYQRLMNQKGPLHVLQAYDPNVEGSARRPALLSMAGNVAEWLRPTTVLPPGVLRPGALRPESSPSHATHSDDGGWWKGADAPGWPRATFARAVGGSYRQRLEDCAVGRGIILDRRMRREEVGVRLALASGSFGPVSGR